MTEIIKSIDWTPIITAFIAVIITIMSRMVIKYAVPWLKRHNLTEAADVAVKAAEAIYGRYNGDEKLRAAIEMLKAQGFIVTSDDVIKAIKAAWQDLNLQMIEAGVKETETTE